MRAKEIRPSGLTSLSVNDVAELVALAAELEQGPIYPPNVQLEPVPEALGRAMTIIRAAGIGYDVHRIPCSPSYGGHWFASSSAPQKLVDFVRGLP